MKGRKLKQLTCKISISSSNQIIGNNLSSGDHNTNRKKNNKQKSPRHRFEIKYQKIISRQNEYIKSNRSPRAKQKKQSKKIIQNSNQKQFLNQKKKLSILYLKEKDHYKVRNQKTQTRSQKIIIQQKKKKKLRQMIELGNQKEKVLFKMYNLRVRMKNQQKIRSLSSSISQKRKISWGSNQYKLKQYAINTLRKICHSMRNIRQKYGGQQDQIIQKKNQLKVQKKHKKQKIQEKLFSNNKLKQIGRKKRFLTEIQEIKNLTKLQDQKKVKNIIKIQRFIRRKMWKIKVLRNLHKKFGAKLKEIGINTDPIIIISQQKMKNIQSNNLNNQKHLSKISKQQDLIPLIKLESELLKQKYQLLIKARQSQQYQLEYIYQNQKGISTNLHVINQYLISLIKYLLMYYEEELLQEMRTFYGSNAIDRIKVFNGWDMVEFQPYIISEQIFKEFEENVIGINQKQKQNDLIIEKMYQHIHNKVIFDCFNQKINKRRSFYEINGEPFLWTISQKCIKKKFINQSQLKEILQDSKNQILEQAKCLLGIFIQETNSQELLKNNSFQQFIQVPLHKHDYVATYCDKRLTKTIYDEIEQNESNWNWMQNQRSQILFNVSQLIQEDLMTQIMKTLMTLKLKRL